MLIDIVNEVLSVNALSPAVQTGSTQGSSQDFTNGEVATNAIVTIGAYSANNTTTQIQIEESADGSTNWSAISGMVCTATATGQIFPLRGLRTYRYVRANAISVSGTTPSVAMGVVILAQKKISGSGGGYSRSPST